MAANSSPQHDPISMSVPPPQSRQSVLSSLKQIRIKPSGSALALDDRISSAPPSLDSILSRVRDLVSAPNFTPSSAAKIVDACAAALPNVEFSDLLQTSNIEGHTALYWAIVNDRLEAFSALAGAISEFSSNCFSDLRLACMATKDQALFRRLNLGNINAKDEPLTRSMGLSPDVILVHEGYTIKRRLGEQDHRIVASFQIKMFQKRLRSTQKLTCEFVAGGRIWWLRFAMGHEWKWTVGFGLSSPSSPACPKATLQIEANAGRVKREFRKGLYFTDLRSKETLVPEGPNSDEIFKGRVAGEPFTSISWLLGDWVMYDNSIYVDCDGTLYATLELTLKSSS